MSTEASNLHRRVNLMVVQIWNTVFYWFCRYLPRCPAPPKTCSSPEDIKIAVDLITTAEKPLVIVGKGRLELLLGMGGWLVGLLQKSCLLVCYCKNPACLLGYCMLACWATVCWLVGLLYAGLFGYYKNPACLLGYCMLACWATVKLLLACWATVCWLVGLL